MIRLNYGWQMLHRWHQPKLLSCILRNLTYSKRNKANVCIVGSGPGGFYTAELLLKESPVQVDIFEKLPVPFGLIRYGVAPDHPEIKKVINKFVDTATHERCNFYGNVNVGTDVTIQELLAAYNAVVLAYGSAEDNKLNITGENAKNVFSARQVVGWYNGAPENTKEPIDLNTEVAAIIGHGNVALDVARIFLRSAKELESTDITEHSLQALRNSKLRKVVIIGRRGPLQVAFTVKELREFINLAGCQAKMNAEDFVGVRDILPTIKRPRHRLTEVLLSTLDESLANKISDANRESEIKFFRTPKAIVCDKNNKVTKLILGVNKVEGQLDSGKVVATEEEEELDCGLVVKSVGYRSTVLDSSIPFNKGTGVISNQYGRISVKDALYCSGWLKTGPVGVIPLAMRTSFETAAKLVSDLDSGAIPTDVKSGGKEILKTLSTRGVPVTTFDHWLKIDAEEQKRGELIGKPREKITRVKDMLDVAGVQ